MTPREIDALVAEKVMGHRLWWWNEMPDEKIECNCRTIDLSIMICPKHSGLPHYSTDIADAWKVAQYLTDHHYLISIRAELGLWGCRVENAATGEVFQVGRQAAPMAICLVALGAVGAEVPA